MSDRSILLRNAASTWFLRATLVVLGFFFSPFLIRHLGEEQYGLWVMVGGVSSLMAIMNFGIGPAVARQVAHYKETGEHDLADRLISTAAVLFAGVFVVALAIAVLATAYFTSFFEKIDPQYHAIAKVLVLIVGISTSVALATRLFDGVVMGHQRFDLLNWAMLGSAFLRVGPVVILFLLGYDNLWVLAIVTFLAEQCKCLANVVLALICQRGMRISLEYVNRADLRYLVGFTGSNFLILIAWTLLEQGGKLIAGKFLSLDLVTQYAIATMLVVMVRQWADALAPLWVPAASAMYARGEHQRLRRAQNIACRYTLGVTMMGTVTLAIFCRPFLGRWLHWTGPDYEGVIVAIYALTAGQLCVSWQTPSVAIVRGLNRHQPLAVAFPLSVAVGLTLSALLAAYTQLGVVGIAVGVALSQVVRTLTFVPWYVCHVLGQSASEHLRRTLLSPLAIAAPSAGLGYLLLRVFAPATYPALFATMGATAGTYALLSYFFVLEQPERDRIKSSLAYLRLWRRARQ